MASADAPVVRAVGASKEETVDRDPFGERDETPTIEVRVFRHGELVHRQLCESEEEAADVARAWTELDDTECEVEDLSARHQRGDVLEPEPPVPSGEGYAEEAEIEQEHAEALRHGED